MQDTRKKKISVMNIQHVGVGQQQKENTGNEYLSNMQDTRKKKIPVTNIQHVGHQEKENTGNEYPTCRTLGKRKYR